MITRPETRASDSFDLRRIAIPAFGPSLLFGLGKGAILPVVALSVRDLGGSPALAALVVTLIGIGSLLSNVPASLLTARYGERAAIVGAAVLGALAMLLCAMVEALWVFALGILMVGMSSAVFNLARQSWLTEAVPIHYRARALSTLGGVMRIGAFIGPFAGAALIVAIGLQGAYWVGLLAMLAAGLVAGKLPDLPGEQGIAAAPAPARDRSPDRDAHGHAGGRLDGHMDGSTGAAIHGAGADATTTVRRMPAPTLRSIAVGHMNVFLTVGIGAMLVSAVRASRQIVVPLWADSIGLDAATTSLIFGLSNAVDMTMFYPAGKLMDRKGRNWVAVPSMTIMGAALMAMPLTTGASSLLLVSLLVGFGNGIGSGMVMTLGADYSPSPGRAHFLGVWRLLSDIGATGGPILLSAATAAVSLAAGIWTAGLLGFAAAAVLGYWIPRGNRQLVERGRAQGPEG